MLRMNEEMAHAIFGGDTAKNMRDAVNHLTSDVTVGLEVIGEAAIERLHMIAGPDSPVLARESERD